MANVRRAGSRRKGKTVAVAAPAENDWWSWVTIATIFAVSTAAVWLPVIIGAGT